MSLVLKIDRSWHPKYTDAVEAAPAEIAKAIATMPAALWAENDPSVKSIVIQRDDMGINGAPGNYTLSADIEVIPKETATAAGKS